MPKATQDRTFPAPATRGDHLPESVEIGGWRFDVKVADQAMLDDPALKRFVADLPSVYRPEPMDHGGTITLRPEHGHDVLAHVVEDYAAYLAKWAPAPDDPEHLAKLARFNAHAAA